MSLTTVAAFITEIGVLLGVVIAFAVWLHKLIEGVKCQLRSDMLRIYYDNKDSKHIRQFEYEHFIKCYEAYKALHGNSFIDKIYKEVQTWTIET